ncbi:MAG TPA: plasmid mobilization relaxosome protein MobC [Nitrospira sp.]|nr:plasmid mobilization relaxosome protein MobC [Nitrospira sp.]
MGVLIWAGTGELMGQRPKRTTTVTVDLGELKAPWQAWCDEHKVTPSHALRNALRQAMDRRATRAPTLRLRITPKPERANARMEVNLTPSELAALKKMAGHEGYVPTKWVVAMIRTKLTGQPHVGQPELEGLARSNQQLLALGRNLNQIARVLNTSPQHQAAFRVEVITELSRVIQAHTKKVSDVLRGTVERWQLQ